MLVSDSNPSPLIWIVMGVSGSGKTTVGRLLSARLECDFLEGDRRHSPENIAKMRSQIPLEDTDRHAWLLALANDLQRASSRGRETVLTCSALKRDYRDRLTRVPRTQLLWLDVPQSELERRLTNRVNHYLSAALLASQIAAFEPPHPEENAIAIDARPSPEQIVVEILERCQQQFPSLGLPWWER